MGKPKKTVAALETQAADKLERAGYLPRPLPPEVYDWLIALESLDAFDAALDTPHLREHLAQPGLVREYIKDLYQILCDSRPPLR